MGYAYDMIQETITTLVGVRKPGYRQEWHKNKCGSPQYYCKMRVGLMAGWCRNAPRAAQFKSLILKTYHERASLHGLERIFQVSPSNGGALALARFCGPFLCISNRRYCRHSQGTSWNWTNYTLVICAENKGQIVGVVRLVPADTPSGRVHHWQPQRKNLSALERTCQHISR